MNFHDFTGEKFGKLTVIKDDGIKLVMPVSKKDYLINRSMTASLDRIDSCKGYTIDNVQWVHKWINVMKSDHSQDEFIALCRAVTTHQERHGNKTAF